MSLHLRPAPVVEYQMYSDAGIFWQGEYIKMRVGQVKLIQTFIENTGKFIHKNKLVQAAGIAPATLRMYVSRARPIINRMGYSLITETETGYKIEPMRKS